MFRYHSTPFVRRCMAISVSAPAFTYEKLPTVLNEVGKLSPLSCWVETKLYEPTHFDPPSVGTPQGQDGLSCSPDCFPTPRCSSPLARLCTLGSSFLAPACKGGSLPQGLPAAARVCVAHTSRCSLADPTGSCWPYQPGFSAARSPRRIL